MDFTRQLCYNDIIDDEICLLRSRQMDVQSHPLGSLIAEIGTTDDYFSAAQGQKDASEEASIIKSEVILRKYILQLKTGYAVGVFGSGRPCRIIRAAGLASYSWLAMSTGWAEYDTYTNRNIKQYIAPDISGIEVDKDEANNLTSIGAW